MLGLFFHFDGAFQSHDRIRERFRIENKKINIVIKEDRYIEVDEKLLGVVKRITECLRYNPLIKLNS